MKQTIFIIFIIFTYSCGEYEKDFQAQKPLNVILRARVIDDDIFDIFYSEGIFKQYTTKNIVTMPIKGSLGLQDIVFVLPKNVQPVKIRMDIGSNNFETPIEIEEIVLMVGNSKRVFKDEDLESFFHPNKYIEKEAFSNVYKRKINDNFYDPYIISINLNSVIKKLFKNNEIE